MVSAVREGFDNTTIVETPGEFVGTLFNLLADMVKLVLIDKQAPNAKAQKKAYRDNALNQLGSLIKQAYIQPQNEADEVTFEDTVAGKMLATVIATKMEAPVDLCLVYVEKVDGGCLQTYSNGEGVLPTNDEMQSAFPELNLMDILTVAYQCTVSIQTAGNAIVETSQAVCDGCTPTSDDVVKAAIARLKEMGVKIVNVVESGDKAEELPNQE